MTHSDLEDLEKRAHRLRLFDGWRITYALFAKAGFTKSCRERAAEHNVLLFEGPDLVSAKGS